MRSLRLSAIAAIALLAVTAPTAQGQITNRLKKLAKDAAKNAVSGGKDSAATATNAAAGNAASSSSKIDLSVTEDRVTMILAVLRPKVEKAQIVAAARRDKEAYDARNEAVAACIREATGAQTMPSQSGILAAQKLLERQEGLQNRYNAASSGKDVRKQLYLADSVLVATNLYTETMFGLEKKCGPAPYTPASVMELRVLEQSGQRADDSQSGTMVSGAALTAMTRYQFGMVRERIALYAMGEAGLVPAQQLGKEGVFTDDELSVLKAHRDELVKMAPLFKGNSLTWSGSSDLRGW